MANPVQRLPENAPGPFYVDDSCIDCDLCRSSVPQVFQRSETRGNSIVHRQPQDPTEVAATRAALSQCPTDSIGEDT